MTMTGVSRENMAPDDAVFSLAVDVGVPQFLVEVGADFDGVVVDGSEEIAGLDAGLGSRSSGNTCTAISPGGLCSELRSRLRRRRAVDSAPPAGD